MKRFAVLASLAIAAPVSAGPWIDDIGRSTSMQFPGAQPVFLSANAHDVAEGVAAFDTLCLKTGFDRTQVEQAALQSGWGFEYRAELMPFKEPVDVGGWNAPDAMLRMANGIFFNKKPQCNLTFQPTGSFTMADVQAALTEHLGAPPTNAAKQFDKKGRPKKYFSPEWSLTGADGATLMIYALHFPENPSAVQLAVLKK